MGIIANDKNQSQYVETRNKFSSSEGKDNIEKLKDLAKLKVEGIISEEEFISMKKKLL